MKNCKCPLPGVRPYGLNTYPNIINQKNYIKKMILPKLPPVRLNRRSRHRRRSLVSKFWHKDITLRNNFTLKCSYMDRPSKLKLLIENRKQACICFLLFFLICVFLGLILLLENLIWKFTLLYKFQTS